MGCEFGLTNPMIQTIWKNWTKTISAFEWSESRIKWFRMSEQSDVDETPIKWFKQETSDIYTISSPLLMIIFVLPKF